MDSKTAASNMRGELSMRVGTDMCMYEGVQWLTESELARRGSYAIDRFARDMNPDSQKIRVTANRTAKFVQKVISGTRPEHIAVECFPPEGSYSSESILNAQVMERLTNSMLDASGYLAAARTANVRRCICGTYGIGFHINAQPRTLNINGREVSTSDQVITAFTFQPTQLILDPFVQEKELHRHEYVIYSDVMTVQKISRTYGVQLDEEDLLTVAQLTPIEHQFNTLSNGRLFSKYKMHSRSKGAIVHQVHCRGDDGRFGVMYISIEVPGQQEPMVVNMDEPVSPFGGDGLPLTLLHGHDRADSMWSIGDAAMLKDDQDRLNLIQTFLFRQLQKNAGYQWVVDESSLKPEHEGQFVNTVAGVIKYKSGTRDRPINPPQLVNYAPPQPMLADLSGIVEASMREQSHKAEGSLGVTKSHVPDATFQRAMDEADQVLGARVSDDISAHERMAKILCGTAIKHAQAGSPSILAALGRAGFGEEEFAIVSGMDPTGGRYSLKIRESSIRYRPLSRRRADLDAAMAAKALRPMQYRRELAAGQDTPITQDDGYFIYDAQKAAMRVVSGMEWEPLSLGDYGEIYIDEFRKALVSQAATLDPMVRQRLNAAIIGQQAIAAREQMLMAAGQPEGAGVPQQQDPEQMNIDAMLAQIDSQIGGGANSQPGLPAA